MAKYYAERAPYYERVYHKPERQSDLRRLRVWVAEAFAGKIILEIACGTGYWTELISHNAASVVALDFNEEVLAYARQKPCAPGKVTFMQGDAFALPHLPRIFDAALAGFWWSHIPKSRLRPFLKGLHDALQPGALVMFFDNAYVEGNSTKLVSRKDSDGNPLSHCDGDGNTYQERVLDDGSLHQIVKNFPEAEELRETLAGSASEIEIQFLTYYWVLTYRTRRS
ncbi:MAG: class I SAM-dependent methyltransferase [Verrucomicrobia bacterium]|nr:MAG: class I SAM-dependent methyltransferase [Verrucomicrobiota bacterium]